MQKVYRNISVFNYQQQVFKCVHVSKILLYALLYFTLLLSLNISLTNWVNLRRNTFQQKYAHLVTHLLSSFSCNAL